MLGLVMAVPCVGGADIVELTNGQRIVGTITDATIAGVVIEVNGAELRIAREDVQSIVFETLRPAPADPPAAPAPTPAVVPPPPAVAAVVPPPAAAPPVADPPAPSAVIPPPTPDLTPVAAALAALGRLQAATAPRLAPADYAAWLEETRRAIAPALGDATSQTEVLDAIGAAIRYHALAAQASAVYEAHGDVTAVGREAVVTECRPLVELIAREAERARLDPKNPAVAGLITVAGGTRALRACAGEHIAEAERRAGAAR